MQPLESVVRDAAERHARGPSLVREVCAREGASKVVRTVVDLISARADGYGEALQFLMDGADGLGVQLIQEHKVPELEAAIAASSELAAAIESAATGAYRDRARAASALMRLPVRNAGELLERFATSCFRRGDVINLGDVFSLVPIGSLVDPLGASPDFLFRWTLLNWTNADPTSEEAGAIRQRLAKDPCRWIAAEAAQHIRILDRCHEDTGTGWSFHVASNYGAAPSFRAITHRFVDSWSVAQSDYTTEELRVFVSRELGDDRS